MPYSEFGDILSALKVTKGSRAARVNHSYKVMSMRFSWRYHPVKMNAYAPMAWIG
jgi:hypothetical protein